MNKLVISVNFSKFRLELAMNRDATIQELVRSMRDNNFFPEDIKTEDLLFLNKNGETLNLQDKVESIVVEPTQPIHFLDVYLKDQMEIDAMQGYSRQIKKLNQLVISVNTSKFRLELAMNRDATIQELVRQMRDTNFFPEDIKTEDLLFLNKNGKRLHLEDKVESIVVQPTQPIHSMDIQMKNHQKH